VHKRNLRKRNPTIPAVVVMTIMLNISPVLAIEESPTVGNAPTTNTGPAQATAAPVANPGEAPAPGSAGQVQQTDTRGYTAGDTSPYAPRGMSGPRPFSSPLLPTQLEDVLLEKGIITQEDWARIKADEEQRAAEATAVQGLVAGPRWYERIRINGYVQMRYALNDNGKCDISLSDSRACTNPQEIYFRRIRMVFSGQISERLFFYLQPAMEGDGFNTGNSFNLVDAFADYMLTTDRQHRLRFGLHRVLNSFDTFRTSSQRQELDRHESIQSGAPGERDLGVSYYWTSKIAQERFQALTQYHNGPGDYGNFGIMVYNGQGRNRPEANAAKGVSARLAHPFELPNGRLVEIGAHAYYNQFVAQSSGAVVIGGPNSTANTRCYQNLRGNGGCQVLDERVNFYLWTPPQPWGIMAEYTFGTGPERDATGILKPQSLRGGYVQGNYTWRYSYTGLLTPYVRWGEYYGGNKNSQGVAYLTRNVNVGLVWEPDTHWRFVAEYLFKHGNNQQSNGGPLAFGQPQDLFNADIVRFQVQWFFN